MTVIDNDYPGDATFNYLKSLTKKELKKELKILDPSGNNALLKCMSRAQDCTMYEEAALFIIEHSDTIDVPSNLGVTPLYRAMCEKRSGPKNTMIAKILIDRGADYCRVVQSRGMLELAITHDHEEIFLHILSKDFDRAYNHLLEVMKAQMEQKSLVEIPNMEKYYSILEQFEVKNDLESAIPDKSPGQTLKI